MIIGALIACFGFYYVCSAIIDKVHEVENTSKVKNSEINSMSNYNDLEDMKSEVKRMKKSEAFDKEASEVLGNLPRKEGK